MSDSLNDSNKADAHIETNSVREAIHLALAPASKLVWGYDLIQEPLERQVAEVLSEVPEDRIIKPALHVVGPAIEAFKFAGDQEILQDFLSRLIAKALDSKTALFALPSYVDIIKSLVPDEALILRLFTLAQQFPMIDVKLKLIKTGGFNMLHRNVCTIGILAKCENQHQINDYLDHLCWLGLFEVPPDQSMSNPKAYEELCHHPSIEQIKKQFANSEDFAIEIDKKCVRLTSLGSEFIKTCVLNKKHKRNIA